VSPISRSRFVSGYCGTEAGAFAVGPGAGFSESIRLTWWSSFLWHDEPDEGSNKVRKGSWIERQRTYSGTLARVADLELASEVGWVSWRVGNWGGTGYSEAHHPHVGEISEQIGRTTTRIRETRWRYW